MQNQLFTVIALLVLTFMILALTVLKMALSKTQWELAKKNKLIEEYKAEIESERAKTDFFINMTHELKTPLSVILGSLQLIELKKPSWKEEHQKIENILKTIKLNSYRLSKLINNILDMARSDSGCLEMNYVNCNIIKVVEDIVQSIMPFAEQKGISLGLNTKTREILADIDIDKFEKIVLNLLSNAIKFTNSGGKINVSAADKGEQVYLSVKDNGLGIPENMHSLIFEKYRQAGDNYSQGYSERGSGIGLSIVKSFVKLHGGDVRVVSKENNGSEFIVELPKSLCSRKEALINRNTRNAHNTPNTNHITQMTAIELSDI